MSIRDKYGNRAPAVIIFFGIFFLLACFATFLDAPREERWSDANKNHSSSLPELWKLTDIQIYSSAGQFVTAPDGNLILIGDAHPIWEGGLTALDGETGKIAWRPDFFSVNTFILSGSTLYVGTPGGIAALDSSNGSILWFTGIMGKGIREIVPMGNTVIASSGLSHYLLDAGTGRILERDSDYYSLGAEARSEDLVYEILKNGDVIAKSSSTGQTVWRQPVQAISNLARTPAYLYVLRERGEVVRLNAQNGALESITQFKPAPFQRSGVSQRGAERIYPYLIAADPIHNRLFVYLGDNAELFAYKISP